MRVQVPRNVIFEKVGEQLVLLNLDTSNYFNLTGSGPRIWELIQTNADLDEVRATLTAEYDVDPETIRGDLDELLDNLEGRGLIVIDRGAS